jgi:hypothetical protein
MNSINAAVDRSQGDVALCYAIRAAGNLGLSFLVLDLNQTIDQLAPLDRAASHDQVLDEETLTEAAEWSSDHIQARLSNSLTACQTSVRNLEEAHSLVAGLFKGEMRDSTEESLGRALKSAQAGLAKLESVVDNYQLPKRPHEIRRNALSFLMVKTSEVREQYLQQLSFHEATLSHDIKEEFATFASELLKMMATFEKLRERSSQKMEQNLQQCLTELEALIERVEALELKAGLRHDVWFPDYAQRTAA